MPATRNLLWLIAILDAEGFGELAGEILTEISAGRIISDGTDQNVSEDDRPPKRVPFAPEEQLREAIILLRARLIEPAIRLAEAEEIAGGLIDSGPIRIVFVDDENSPLKSEFDRAPPGEATVATKLDKLLHRIAFEQDEGRPR